MKQKGIVKEINGEFATVSVLRAEACSSCSGRNFCGSARQAEVRVKNAVSAQIGETVEIETPSEKVLGYAALVFLSPVLLAVGLYLLLYRFSGIFAGIAAFLGFIIPFAFAYFIDKKRPDTSLPEITGVICPEKENAPCFEK